MTAAADGEGVVSHAGSRQLADVGDRTTLTAELFGVLAGPRARHDPGRILLDLAVAVAEGVTTISDIAVLADQAELFGAVALGFGLLAPARPARPRCAERGRPDSSSRT